MENLKQEIDIDQLSYDSVKSILPFGWRIEQTGTRLYTNPESKKVVVPILHVNSHTGESDSYLKVPGNTLRLLQRVCIAKLDEDICDSEIQRDLDLRHKIAFVGYDSLSESERMYYRTFVLDRERVAWSMTKGIYEKNRASGVNLESKMSYMEIEKFFEGELFLLK